VTEGHRYSAPAAACAAEVLNALKSGDAPLTLAQMERTLPRSKSLIFRVLRELQAHELVVRDSAGRFRLGVEAFEMATAYLSQWTAADVVRQALEQLAQDTGDTVNLGVLRGSEVLYLMKFQGSSAYITISRVGGRVPANCVAIGKALLAQLTDDEVRQRFIEPLPQMTERSVATVDALLDELQVVRGNGFAVDREQAALGRCAVALAAQVANSRQELAGISISTAASSFDDRLDHLLDRLLQTQARLDRDSKTRSALAIADHTQELALPDLLPVGDGRTRSTT
jgi:DNA-binding IclR family transcriptional regulator